MRKIAWLLTFAIVFESIFTGTVTAAELSANDIVGQSYVQEVTEESGAHGSVSTGDISMGDVSDGNLTEEIVSGGDVSDGNLTEEIVSGGDVSDGNVFGETASSGDVSEGDLNGGEVVAFGATSLTPTVYPYACEYEDGYLVLLDLNTNSIGNAEVQYTLDGKSHTVAGHTEYSVGSKLLYFFIDRNLVENGAKKQLSIYAMLNSAFDSYELQTTAEIQFMEMPKSMVREDVDAMKDRYSDGRTAHVGVDIFTAYRGDVVISKLAVEKDGREIVVYDDWNLRLEACKVADPRYLLKYPASQSTYCWYGPYGGACLNKIIYFPERLEEGSYDLVLYREGEGLNKLIFKDYIEVHHDPVVTYCALSESEGLHCIDNTTGKYVAVWVYGINIDQRNIPTMRQNGVRVSEDLLATELLKDNEGCLYKIAVNDKYDMGQESDFFLSGAKYWIWSNSLQESHLGDTPNGEYSVRNSYYSYDNIDCILEIENHSDCLLDYVRVYLAQAYVTAGQTVGVQADNYWDDISAEKVFRVVQKDLEGRLYVEIDNTYSGYQLLDWSNWVSITITNKSGEVARTECFGSSHEGHHAYSLTRVPSIHMDNLIVPKGCTWQIMEISDVGKEICSGVNTGSAVLSEDQLRLLSTYSSVRVNIYRDGIIIDQQKVIFSNEADRIDEELVKLVGGGEAPKLSVIKDSATTRSVGLVVTNPDYVVNADTKDLQYVFEAVDAAGKKTTIYADVVAAKSQEVYLEILDLTGSKYIASARIAYMKKKVILSQSKKSNEVSFIMKYPYEKELSLKKGTLTVKQGNVAASTLATVRWRNADILYQYASVEVKKGPKNADLSLLQKALYYDYYDKSIKLQMNSEAGWDGVYAGHYTLRVSAMQENGDKVVSKDFTINILQNVKTVTVQTPLTRYYKISRNNLRIRPKVTEYDYAGKVITGENKVPVKCSLKFYDTQFADLLVMDPKSGDVLVNREFGSEGDKVVFSIVARTENGKVGNSWDVTVSSEKRAISTVRIADMDPETLKKVKTYQIDGKTILLKDQNKISIHPNDVNFTTKGNSLKVDANGMIHTTGKAGTTTIIATLKDGSKSTVKIPIEVLMDRVSVRAYYGYTYDAIPLDEFTTERPDIVNTIEYTGDPILFHFVGTNGKIVSIKTDAIDYTVKCKTGIIIDYGKVRDNLKSGSGIYMYIPKTGEDVITVTDKSYKRPVVTQYRIVIPSMTEDAQHVTVKHKKAEIYTQMAAGKTISYEILDEFDYTGYSAILESNYAYAGVSAKMCRDYKYIQSQFYGGRVLPGNKVVFRVKENAAYDLPVGVYEMKLFLSNNQGTLAPVNVKVAVSKIPKATAKLATSPIKMNTANRVVALQMEGKNATAIAVSGVGNKRIDNTAAYNSFSAYFKAEMVDGRPRITYKGTDIKSVPKLDREGILYYTVTDYAGFTHEYSMKIKIDIR